MKLKFFLFLCLPLSLFAQNSIPELATFLLPDSLKENAHSVIRNYEEQFVVEDGKTARKQVRKVVTLLNKRSGQNKLVLRYDSDSKITQFKASLYDGMGNKIRDIKKSEIVDQLAVDGVSFYTDSRVKYIEVEYFEYPYTIVFEYEKKLKNFGVVETPVFYPQRFHQSVQKSSLVVKVPSNNELLYDAFNMPAVQLSTSQGLKIYTWKVKSLPAQISESFSPPHSRVLPNVYTVLKDVEIVDGHQSSFETWDDYGKMLGLLYEGRSSLPASLQAEVESLIAGVDSDREKIDKLYRFMQDRMRYVSIQLGIGGWQPFSANYVEENRYGDCKALSNYMKSILAVADIESYPTIVYSGNPSYKAHSDFTSYIFNHAILYVPSEDMYLECTSSYDPPGYRSPSISNRNVLWVTPDGGQLANIPPVHPADHGHLRTQHIKLEADGSASLALSTRYVGSEQESWRYYSHELSEKDLKDALQSKDQIPDVTGTSFSLLVNDDEPIVDLNYETTLPRYARKMGKRFFVPINRFFPFDVRPPKLDERKLPIVFESGKFIVDSVKIELPEGLHLEAIGEPIVHIKHERGEYQATSSLDGNTFTWVRTLRLNPVNLPADAYDELRAFYLAVGKADKKQLVFKLTTR